MSIVLGFVLVGSAIFALNEGLIAIENMTGENVATLILDTLPNIVKFVNSVFELFRMFFELLPSYLQGMFFLFLSVMSIITLYKAVKGGS